MSSTNSTTTIGLSQYISTDKPTYLTDYNGDMLKIDDAIASDREGIAGAQNKANTADGKADANKTSIDTLNGQINGDPTATPPTSGLAGKVASLENSVNTLGSLMGNGHPTTSDQTVIGAINNLEDTIAPSEDNSTLGADYDAGEKFMRGGTLCEALVNLTAGTAFSALTLNTDYKVADRLVEQISNKASDEKIGALTDLETTVKTNVVAAINEVNEKGWNFAVINVTADGVKTISVLLDELHAATVAKFEQLNAKYFYPVSVFGSAIGIGCTAESWFVRNAINSPMIFTADYVDSSAIANGVVHHQYDVKSSSSVAISGNSATGTYSDVSSTVPASGATVGIEIMYRLV